MADKWSTSQASTKPDPAISDLYNETYKIVRVSQPNVECRGHYNHYNGGATIQQ